MPPLTQKSRPIAVGTPLGDDALIITGMSGSERLGRPFQYELELVSEQPEKVKFEKIVGHNVTVRLALHDQSTRHFNGYVSRFVHTQWDGTVAHYRATVVPWLWFLTRTADCRIFQKMKVPDIIKKVFDDHPTAVFEKSLSGTYREWDYCVQYRETDFNFVSRLMEQEGIYYYFTHDNGKHTLVLADSPAAHNPIAGTSKLPYFAPSQQRRDQEFISQWMVNQEVQPGHYVLNEFDYLKPSTPLQAKTKSNATTVKHTVRSMTIPANTPSHATARITPKLRIHELHSQFQVIQGASDARSIASGSTFKLSGHPMKDQEKEYLLTNVAYQLTSDVLESSTGQDIFSCTFEVIESSEQYRAERITPKPIIQGPQTAMVVGPSGEEIHTDKHGRIKVQFHWDRYGKHDENSSCWIRVAQLWAGKKWGGQTIPRIGHEVMVEFLEGDPDQPIVTGRVYNAEAMPPYKLPAHKTVSTLKSNSSKGGAGFNELRFEDKKGEEQVFFHGEKDLDHRVKNDTREWIGNDRHLIVVNNQTELVKVDKHGQVKGNHLEKVDGKVSLEVGAERHTKVGTLDALEAGKEVHIKAGMKVIIDAGMQLTLNGPAALSTSAQPA